MTSSPLLLPPPTEDPIEMARRASLHAPHDIPRALAGLQDAARHALRRQEPRNAALILHRRAGLAMHNGESPIPDLAMAARLLVEYPEERALVLLDLGQVLYQSGETARATLTLRESERLARRAESYELAAAARHLLGQVAYDAGDYAGAREFLRDAGQALIFEVEHDLLSTLRDLGNLPRDTRAEMERARREQAVEEELAALKRSLGLERGGDGV